MICVVVLFTYAVGRYMSHWCVSRGWCCLCTDLTKSGCGLNSISLEFTGNEVTLKQFFLNYPQKCEVLLCLSLHSHRAEDMKSERW